MSIEFGPLSLDRLLDWIRRERAVRGTIFGLHEDLFRDDLAGRPFAMQRRGHLLDAPLGVAAGAYLLTALLTQVMGSISSNMSLE